MSKIYYIDEYDDKAQISITNRNITYKILKENYFYKDQLQYINIEGYNLKDILKDNDLLPKEIQLLSKYGIYYNSKDHKFGILTLVTFDGVEKEESIYIKGIKKKEINGFFDEKLKYTIIDLNPDNDNDYLIEFKIINGNNKFTYDDKSESFYNVEYIQKLNNSSLYINGYFFNENIELVPVILDNNKLYSNNNITFLNSFSSIMFKKITNKSLDSLKYGIYYITFYGNFYKIRVDKNIEILKGYEIGGVKKFGNAELNLYKNCKDDNILYTGFQDLQQAIFKKDVYNIQDCNEDDIISEEKDINDLQNLCKKIESIFNINDETEKINDIPFIVLQFSDHTKKIIYDIENIIEKISYNYLELIDNSFIDTDSGFLRKAILKKYPLLENFYYYNFENDEDDEDDEDSSEDSSEDFSEDN